MFRKLPKPVPGNPPMTRGQRRVWLATLEQKRRHGREQGEQPALLPAPVLRAVYPDVLAWDWDLANPYRWNVWLSWDNGATWTLVDDYWALGADRDFWPDGGSELYFIVGVDASGNEITEHSNQVRPDDAPPPTPNAPVITSGSADWEATEAGWFDVSIQWTFDHGSYPVAQLEIWQSIDGGSFNLLTAVNSQALSFTQPQVADTEATFRFKLRYRDGTTYGPFSNEFVVDCMF